MDVKEAVANAKTYLSRVFAGEEVVDVRLEEVEYDSRDQAWLITLGLMRPTFLGNQGQIAAIMGPKPLKRTYKVVRVPEMPGEKPSIKIREFNDE